MEYWKWRAIDRLKDYDAQKAAVMSIPDEIRMLESESTSIRGQDTQSVSVKGSGGRSEDKLLSNYVRRVELAGMLDRAKLATETVERGLAALDKDECRIVNCMYVAREKGAVGRLADEYGLEDERSVYKRVDKALRHFTIAMYGATES